MRALFICLPLAAMVLELRYVRSRRFARARPRAGPRGAANLGTSSSVPGIEALGNVSTEIETGTAGVLYLNNTRLRKIPSRHTNRLEELTDLKQHLPSLSPAGF